MARFLQLTDYRPLIKDEYLAQILESDEATRFLAEDAAIQEMKPYLSAYDTEKIFAGTDRNELLVLFCVDIALYHLMSSIQHPRLYEANSLRVARYERAIKWLEQVSQGIITPEGLAQKNKPNANPKIFLHANPKRQQHF